MHNYKNHITTLSFTSALFLHFTHLKLMESALQYIGKTEKYKSCTRSTTTYNGANQMRKKKDKNQNS